MNGIGGLVDVMTPAEMNSETVDVVTNVDASAEPAPAAPPEANVTKVIVAVHGVGDQYSYATIQAVVNRFCSYYGDPAAIPLGSFHNGTPAFSVSVPPYTPALSPFGFAEVYWAAVPRKLVDDKHTLEESKTWARTLVERLELRRREEIERARGARRASENVGRNADYGLLSEVLGEMLESIAVADRLCYLAEKAGVLTFDLRRLLDDYLGDVQVVTEFATHRRTILDAFAKTMADVRTTCPNAAIYVVAHSEGTVVSFLGLLEAFRQPSPPDWTSRVRGFMTLGSPIDKHLALWPQLFADPLKATDPPVSGPPLPIAWRNYYDYGDPIGFALDDTRAWLAKHRWTDVFDFTQAKGHDNGFARYPFPGKAHTEYWSDDAVFGHFIETVVCDTGLEHAVVALGTDDEGDAVVPALARPLAPNRYASPPRDIRGRQALSYGAPYALIAALLCLAAYVMYKAVVGAITPDGAPPQDALAIARDVVGIASLLAGTTILARVPRLTRSATGWVIALSAGATGAAVYLTTVRGSAPPQLMGVALTDLTAAVAVGLGLLAAVFRWHVRSLMLSGTLAAASVGTLHVWAAPQHSDGGGALWPLFLAALGFLYLWWLGTLMFDLTFVWHHYIRHSKIREGVRAMLEIEIPKSEVL